jgi:hypothetical protein
MDDHDNPDPIDPDVNCPEPADEAGEVIAQRLRRLIARRRHLLNRICEGISFMSKEVDDLISAVQEERTVSDSVEELLTRLFAMFQANAGDRTKMTTLLGELRANIEKEKAAITANTPMDAEPNPNQPAQPAPTQPGEPGPQV